MDESREKKDTLFSIYGDDDKGQVRFNFSGYRIWRKNRTLLNLTRPNTMHLAFVPDFPWIRFKELTGAHEQMIDGCDTAIAIHLLDQLIVEGPGSSLAPGMAARLTAADRDRLLCAIYCSTYGSRISGTVACAECHKAFDLDFDLIELQATLQPAGVANPMFANGQMAFMMADGRSFRLPTGEDELAIWHLPADKALAELLRRCVLKGGPHLDPHSVQAAMQAVAPLLDVELTGHCPECGRNQAIHFDIQSYLLSALQAEKPRLMREVHRLATAYGWPLGEILNLSRSQRRAYVKLIEDEASRYARI